MKVCGLGLRPPGRGIRTLGALWPGVQGRLERERDQDGGRGWRERGRGALEKGVRTGCRACSDSKPI